MTWNYSVRTYRLHNLPKVVLHLTYFVKCGTIENGERKYTPGQEEVDMVTSEIVWMVVHLTMVDGTKTTYYPHSDMQICERDLNRVDLAIEIVARKWYLKDYLLKMYCYRRRL